MRKGLIVAMMVLLVLVPDTLANDKERIQGIWIIVEVEFDGVPLPDSPQRAHFVGSKLTFQGDWVINSQQPNVKARVVMDPGANPPTLDIITMPKNEERRMLYTYQLAGDSLRLCFTRNSSVIRPTNVTSSNKQLLLILKRQTEAQK